jgi:hypothetical protein
LADARSAALDDQETIRSLHTEIEALKKAQDVEHQLELRGTVYYRVNGAGETGPFCSPCYQIKKKLIPLTRTPPPFHAHGQYTCPHCKAMM